MKIAKKSPGLFKPVLKHDQLVRLKVLHPNFLSLIDKFFGFFQKPPAKVDIKKTSTHVERIWWCILKFVVHSMHSRPWVGTFLLLKVRFYWIDEENFITHYARSCLCEKNE